jgi:hypothetical protein
MSRLISQRQWPHRRNPGHAGAGAQRRAGLTAASIARMGIAASAALFFLGAALASDEPVVMLVGLFPIAWLAVEAVWVTLRQQADCEDD